MGRAAKVFGIKGLKLTYFEWSQFWEKQTQTRILWLQSAGISGHFSQHVTSFSFQTSVLKIAWQTLWTIVSFKHNMDCMCADDLEEVLCETRHVDSLFRWIHRLVKLILNTHAHTPAQHTGQSYVVQSCQTSCLDSFKQSCDTIELTKTQQDAAFSLSRSGRSGRILRSYHLKVSNYFSAWTGPADFVHGRVTRWPSWLFKVDSIGLLCPGP